MQAASGVKGLYLKRGWWYYQPPKIPGVMRPKAVALETKEFRAAQRKVQEFDSAEKREARLRAGTMREALPKYFLAKADSSKLTRQTRKYVLEMFRDANGNPKLTEISAQMIREWRALLAESGGRRDGNGSAVTISTLRSYTVILRAFLKWSLDEGLIDKHPLPKMERTMKVGKVSRIEEFLTQEERDRLMGVEMPDYMRLILLLGCYQGMRYGEMLALNKGWLWVAEDWSRGVISVEPTAILYTDGKAGTWTPKSNRSRRIDMHPLLLEYFKAHGFAEPWILAPQKDKWPVDTKRSKRYEAKRMLDTVRKRAGLAVLNFHMLRHTFATHLAMKGVAMAKIAEYLGDRITVVEEHYAGFAPGKGNPLAIL